MNNFRRIAKSAATKFAIAVVAISALICCAWAHPIKLVTAASGVPTLSNKHFRVDKQGHEWPVEIQVTKSPDHGTVRTQSVSTPRTLRDGTTKTVHETRVVYQSSKGFAGQDAFVYRRISGDPSDRSNNENITILVTVK
jgi:hypothetical protein